MIQYEQNYATQKKERKRKKQKKNVVRSLENPSKRKYTMKKVKSNFFSYPPSISFVNNYNVKDHNLENAFNGGNLSLLPGAKRLPAATSIARKFCDRFQIA